MLRRIRIIFTSYIYNHNNFICDLLRRIHRSSMEFRARGWREHIVPKRMGDKNPDKTVCMITFKGGFSGLFSLHVQALSRIITAFSRGFTPCVDMRYPMWLADEEPRFGTTNAYEYFFEQPCGISPEEAEQSANVVYADDWRPSIVPALANYSFLTGGDGRLKEYCEIVEKWTRFNSRTLDHVKRAWDSLRPPDGNEVLAVISRGTDYRKLRPLDHPEQPSAETLLERAKEITKSKGIRYVYLKTEERFVVDMFRDAFGDGLLTFESSYYDAYSPEDEDGTVHTLTAETEKDYLGAFINSSDEKTSYEIGLEYVTNIYCAAQCDYLLAGINSSTIGAVLFNGCRYKEKHIIYTRVYW